MPDPSSDSPALTGALGDHAVAVAGDNLGTINTGLIVNIQGDDIEKNVEVARMVLAASRLAPPLDPQRKAEIVDYYRRIARTLNEAAEALRQGTIPYGKCGEMEAHAMMLPEELGDVIGHKQAAALAGKLLEAHRVEGFGYQFMQLPLAERNAKFGTLDEAAGYFCAAADVLRLR